MFNFRYNGPAVRGAVLVSLLLAGCSGISSPVRNLSSDVCLVMPESTTRQEVLSFLGEPDRKLVNSEKMDVWLYEKVNQDFTRKFPVIGDKLGEQNYETVTVTFDGNLVRTCLYRQFDEAEFEKFNSQLPE